MGRTFDIGKYASQLAKASVVDRQINTAVDDGTRDIETVTAEILRLKEDAGNAILGIGQRLIEAKAMLSHGEWLPWLNERVEFSERTAQNLMKLARQWRNPQILADLGATKALTLLALPPEERERFLAENHLVDGEEKSVIDMTSRELERAIRERDEARQAAEDARAEAQAAEESREKMESDMQALKALHASAQAAEEKAQAALVEVQAELKTLRERPVEVAVETVADPEASARARADAIAEMKTKVDQAESARKEAEAQRRAAEKALEESRGQAEASSELRSRAEQAEAELAEVRRQLEALERAEKTAALDSEANLAAFHVLFDQAQAQVRQMKKLLQKVRERDKVSAGKMQNALLALADLVRRGVE